MMVIDNERRKNLVMTDTTTATDNQARRAATIESASQVPIKHGVVAPEHVGHNIVIAEAMARSKTIAKILRGDVYACIAIVDMAQNWGFSHYQVARLVYDVNGQMGFEAQLIHAVILAHGHRYGLIGRLQFKYDGEDDNRCCSVSGIFKNEVAAQVYRSPPIGKITPKNSPLWRADPDQQLGYFSVRSWARKYAPEIIMGIYTRDELIDNPHLGADNAIDVTKQADELAQRLQNAAQATNGQQKEGFAPTAVKDAFSEEGGDTLAPQPEKRARGRPKGKKGTLPRNFEEYRDYLAKWIADSEPNEIDARWVKERQLRNACGIVEEERAQLAAMIISR
jgi:RecT family